MAMGPVSPLWDAATRSEEDVPAVLRALQFSRGTINEVTCGMTPLVVAVQWGHRNVVNILIEEGADPRFCCCGGNTPLHIAARRGHSEICWALLIAGADPTLKNEAGRTPLDLAVTLETEETLQEAFQMRVVTIKLVEVSTGVLTLSCLTMAGNEAASFQWCNETPVHLLKEAVVAAVQRARFTGLGAPLGHWNLCLVTAQGHRLDLQEGAPKLQQQLEEAFPAASALGGA